MRILDKYLLREFLLPWMYSFDAIAILAVTLDLMSHLDEFLHGHASAGQIAMYYLNVLPSLFVLILPVSLLLGVLFCLSNLGKHSELQAMRASGVGVFRIAAPMLAIGLLASVGVFFLNEQFAIRGEERARHDIEALRGRKGMTELSNFFFANAPAGRDWYARWFNTVTRQMTSVEIHQLKADQTPQFDIYAERAEWTNDTWQLRDVILYDYREIPPVVTRNIPETNFPFLTETPARLAMEGKKPDQLTAKELRRYLRAQKRAGQANLARHAVTLHYRYAFPFTCFIVVWLAVPLGMRASRRGPMLGVGMALLLVVAFYFVSHFALAFGNGERLPPVLAAWLTNIIFAGVGTYLFWRAR